MGHVPLSTYSRAAELDWVETKPGIFTKLLHEDAAHGERTLLTRMSPGARSAPHAHEDFEQIHVIEGSFHDGQRELGVGDHCCRDPGAMHEASTSDGALVLVIYTPRRGSD